MSIRHARTTETTHTATATEAATYAALPCRPRPSAHGDSNAIHATDWNRYHDSERLPSAETARIRIPRWIEAPV